MDQLRSFDKTESFPIHLFRPEKKRNLDDFFKKNAYFCPRGSGLSYPLLSASKDAHVLSMDKFNFFIKWDSDNHVVWVTSGVTVGDVLNFALKKGYYLPVLPGHPQISVGGCVGSNIHGKSSYHTGLFGDWVFALKIFHPDHGEIICSKTENADIFHLTIGGFGLTGVILEVGVKLLPLKVNCIKKKRIFVSNIYETADVMLELSHRNNGLYSWNDFSLPAFSFGKGFVYEDELSEKENIVDIDKFNELNPMKKNFIHNGLYNFFTNPLFLKAYYLKEYFSKKERNIGIKQGSFPINGKEFYFSFFGKNGFREYQMLIPFEKFKAVMEQVEYLIKKEKIITTLASLKVFRGKGKYLNFSGNGICIAINFPAHLRYEGFLSKLDALMISEKIKVNLAKDSRVGGDVVTKVYPEYDIFRNQLKFFDPKRRVQSSLRERLNL